MPPPPPEITAWLLFIGAAGGALLAVGVFWRVVVRGRSGLESVIRNAIIDALRPELVRLSTLELEVAAVTVTIARELTADGNGSLKSTVNAIRETQKETQGRIQALEVTASNTSTELAAHHSATQRAREEKTT